MKNIRMRLLLSAAMFISTLALNAQDSKKSEKIKAIVESQDYVFKAQTVLPQTGIAHALTSDYDVTVTRDLVVSYLPYFGRAYSVPINPSEGGIKFSSSKFSYKTVRKSKGWEISIKPNDAPDVQEFYLDIFDNGSASLRVNSTNRQSISFEGYITENKSKKAF